jgi:hypothetical protein
MIWLYKPVLFLTTNEERSITGSLWTREIASILDVYAEQFELRLSPFDGLKMRQNPESTNYR